MRTIPRSAAVILSALAMAGCAATDLVLNPSTAEFPYGDSVRLAASQQALPPQGDPLAVVEGANGEFLANAMQAFKDSAKPDNQNAGREEIQSYIISKGN